jgi:hypothetical protein
MASDQAANEAPVPKPRVRLLRWVGHGADIAVIISVVLMFVIYRNQQADAMAFAKRNTTVNMMSLRYQDRILSAEKGINDYIIKNQNLYARVELATTDDPAPEVVLDGQVRADFVLMIDFYSDILSCVESEQCDKQLVDRWFRSDICQFSKNGKIIGFPQIVKLYGNGLVAPLTKYTASQECNSPDQNPESKR